MSLPKPVLSVSLDAVIVLSLNGPERSASLIWRIWSEDPIKAAVLRAMLSCQTRIRRPSFLQDMAPALCQNMVCSSFISLD